jgi:type I restriction enzyme S subunit
MTDMTQERRIVAQSLRVPELDGGFAVPSLDLSILRPVDPRMQVYLYAVLRYSGFGERVRQYANGANVLHLSTDAVLKQQISVPEPKALTAFEALLGPLLAESELLEVQNQQLLGIRREILPRLVTGQLDISDINLGVLTPAEAK